MAYGAALLFLAVLSVEDIKEKTLSLRNLIIFGLLGLGYFLLYTEPDISAFFGRVFPGILLLMLARLTKESIGYGDGLVVMDLGLWIGERPTLYVLWVAASAAGIWGIVQLIRKKKETIPFVPFLLFGMGVVMVGL